MALAQLCGLNPCQNDCPELGIGKGTAKLTTMVAFQSLISLCVLPTKLKRINALPLPDGAAGFVYVTSLCADREKMISLIQSH